MYVCMCAGGRGGEAELRFGIDRLGDADRAVGDDAGSRVGGITRAHPLPCRLLRALAAVVAAAAAQLGCEETPEAQKSLPPPLRPIELPKDR